MACLGKKEFFNMNTRFVQWTGHITIGGSICTQDLTTDGWNTDMTFPGLILQLNTNIVDGKGQVDMYNTHEYSEAESFEAFKRVVRDHGWKVPAHSFNATTGTS